VTARAAEQSKARILAIETSCDETAAAVVDGGLRVISSVVSSQVDLHARYGGVVPELASRAHIEQIVPVVTLALEGAGLDGAGHPLTGQGVGGPPTGGPGPPEPAETRRIDAVAATVGPGLVGALLVGISFAKALAMAGRCHSWPSTTWRVTSTPPSSRIRAWSSPSSSSSCPAATRC